MKRPSKGNSGRKRNRPGPPLADYVAPSHQEAGSPDDQFHQGNESANRPWKRNMRRPEPLTPENSWLATQPEFQRYWGNGENPDEYGYSEPPQVYDDQYGHPPEPAEPLVPKPRRKPADISTLMARYTAKTEEEAKRRLPPPPPLPKAPLPQPRGSQPQKAPQRAAGQRAGPLPTAQRQGPTTQNNANVPAPEKRQRAPDIGISALPAELPEGEPAPLPNPAPSKAAGSLAVPSLATTSGTIHTPSATASTVTTGQTTEQTKGSFVVTDGQVRLVDRSKEETTPPRLTDPKTRSGRPSLRSLTDINQGPPQISSDTAISRQANDNIVDADIGRENETQNDGEDASDTAADPRNLQEEGTPASNSAPDEYAENQYADDGYADGEYEDDDYALVDPEQETLVPFSEQASMQNPAYADVTYGDDDYVDEPQGGYQTYEDDPNVWQSQGYITQGYDSQRDGGLPVDHFHNGVQPPAAGAGPNAQHWPGEPHFGPSSQPASGTNWNSLGSHNRLDPAWNGTGEQNHGTRFWPKFIFFILVLGAAGYGAWAYGPEKLINTAATTATQIIDSVTKSIEGNDQTSLPGDAGNTNFAEQPMAPETPAENSTASQSTNTIDLTSGSRLAPDPSMRTRQLDNPGGQSTTLWWRAKTVTQFPALTEAELAGQPQPITPAGEAVMAPTGPLEDLNQLNPAAQASSPADTEFARISKLISNYQISDAASAVDKLIAANPSAPIPHVLKGQTNLLQAQYLDALNSFDRALNNEPQNISALIGRGNALVNLGRAIEAQQIANALLTTSPNQKEAMWLNAEALGATGKLEDAMQICDGLGASGASISEAEWCRGVANKRARRPLQTESNFANALQGGDANFISQRQRYFRFKGYYNGEISGTVDGALMQASTRCAATRDCDIAGL